MQVFTVIYDNLKKVLFWFGTWPNATQYISITSLQIKKNYYLNLSSNFQNYFLTGVYLDS